jgi:hypothetical protein
MFPCLPPLSNSPPSFPRLPCCYKSYMIFKPLWANLIITSLPPDRTAQERELEEFNQRYAFPRPLRYPLCAWHPNSSPHLSSRLYHSQIPPSTNKQFADVAHDAAFITAIASMHFALDFACRSRHRRIPLCHSCAWTDTHNFNEASGARKTVAPGMSCETRPHSMVWVL